MDVNKILTADILDIIFEGKNKAYGAYDLRRTYEKRVKIALAGTFAICLLLFVGSIVANSSSKSKSQIIVEDVNLENVKKKKSLNHRHRHHHQNKNLQKSKWQNSPLQKL